MRFLLPFTVALTLALANLFAVGAEPPTIRATDASEYVGKEARVVFLVRALHQSGTKLAILSASAKYDEPGNFLAVIPRSAKRAFEEANYDKPQVLKDVFLRKQVAVTGKIEMVSERYVMELTEHDAIEYLSEVGS